jgi:hypothetical protein
MNTKNQHNFIVKQMLIFLFESRSWSQMLQGFERVLQDVSTIAMTKIAVNEPLHTRSKVVFKSGNTSHFVECVATPLSLIIRFRGQHHENRIGHFDQRRTR